MIKHTYFECLNTNVYVVIIYICHFYSLCIRKFSSIRTPWLLFFSVNGQQKVNRIISQWGKYSLCFCLVSIHVSWVSVILLFNFLWFAFFYSFRFSSSALRGLRLIYMRWKINNCVYLCSLNCFHFLFFLFYFKGLPPISLTAHFGGDQVYIRFCLSILFFTFLIKS